MRKKPLIIGVAALALVAVLVWAFMESTKPLPGAEALWDNRDHKAQDEQIEYRSNPPTSGPHYADWIRPGIYETPQIDGNLVHSLEHGYVILSYNCDRFQAGLIRPALAHGIEEEATGSAIVATGSATLSDKFKSDKCHKLVDELIAIYEQKGKKKLIITPRPGLDAKIALTAWGRIDKFESFDEKRIETFIDKLRDHGPEKTME